MTREANAPAKTIGRRLGDVGASYVDVARSPSYFPLWLSQLVSNFGDTLHYIALVILVYQLTGQGVAVAILVAAEVIPILLLGPVAGVIIDRVDRKAVLIGPTCFARLSSSHSSGRKVPGMLTRSPRVSPPETSSSIPRYKRSSRPSRRKISGSRRTRSRGPRDGWCRSSHRPSRAD
jgi:hypothetical protein